MSKNVKIIIDFILRNIIVAGLAFKNMETKIRLEIKSWTSLFITFDIFSSVFYYCHTKFKRRIYTYETLLCIYILYIMYTNWPFTAGDR